MPIPKPPTPLNFDTFHMASNPDAIAGVQANETFMLTGLAGGALGKGGETVGFAKYQFDGQKLVTSTAESLRLPGVIAGINQASGELTSALAQAAGGNDNAAELQTKMSAAVKALKGGLPAAERDGVDAMNPQQVLAAMQAALPGLEQRSQEAAAASAALGKVEGAAVDLFDPGLPTPADRGLLARSVASSQVDQLLGTNILAEETFGVTREGDVVGVSIQGDGAGITGTYRFNEGGEKKDYSLKVDLKNPALQRGLADLEAVDYLTGQIDRHCGNMFVDQNNKVTGIDNDLAFPERSLEETTQGMPKGMRAKVVGKMPQQMHQETAQKILALDPDTLRQTLKNMPAPDKISKLSDAAIESACGRLVQMQNELKQPGGAIKVVAEFNDDTYNAAMAAQQAEVQAKLGGNIEDTDVDNAANLSDVPKTSYLGAVAIQTKRYELNAQQVPGNFLVRDQNTAPQAPRNAEAAIYAKQLEVAKQAMTSNPAFISHLGADAQQAQAITRELKELKDKVAHYEKEQAGLQKNKLGSLVRSLASGGTAKRQEFYAEKKFEAMQLIGQLQKQLDTIAENALSNELKTDARAYAREAVASHAAKNQPVAAQNNAVQNQPVAVQPNPALAGMVPNHPAPPPPGQFNHPPPSDMAPAVPNQDNLAQGNDQPKAAKARIAAKSKEGDLTVKAADDELVVSDLEELDADVEVEVEVKKEGLAKAPSVAEMLKRTNSAPQLGGHKAAQGVGGEEPKPAGNSLRASGSWQAAKPSGPKPGGNSLTSSHL
ncbi:MAG: hypothetical protein WAW39_30230 [Prosthecobacter sp.]|uniref:hypothetical protein n=1 Tax=Prosthecobacter sp. TaxID=1965333 RepID=UPI003BB0FE44